jgi:hypothetical protein
MSSKHVSNQTAISIDSGLGPIMIKYKSVKIVLFYSSLFLFISTYSHASSIPTRIGYAYDKSSKELLYIEKHYQINNSNGMPLHAWVIYTDKDGNQIAGKTNNFSRDLLMPDFHLKNHQTGHIESVREKSGDLIVSFIRNSDSKLKEKILEKSSDGIIDAGFDNAVIESWGRIIIGEVIEKNFLIPSMMRFIRLTRKFYCTCFCWNDLPCIRIRYSVAERIQRNIKYA